MADKPLATPEEQREAVKRVSALGSTEGSTAIDGVPLLRNYINGEWKWEGETIDVFNPATGEVSCRLPRSSAADVDSAVKAAWEAQASWSTTPATARAELLERVARTLRERCDELALLESCDAGKPVRLARLIDIPRAAENFDFFARMIRTDATTSHAMADAVNYTQRMPVGVAALVTPWNLPLYLLSWKVAPALACGNTIVAKPSEMTPLTACCLAQILEGCGLPKGVFNIVHGLGPEAGAPLVSHKKVRLVSFTGGTVTGSRVAIAAAPTFKKCSLELGGKNPAIVFELRALHAGAS